jgi:hypothetical protein
MSKDLLTQFCPTTLLINTAEGYIDGGVTQQGYCTRIVLQKAGFYRVNFQASAGIDASSVMRAHIYQNSIRVSSMYVGGSPTGHYVNPRLDSIIQAEAHDTLQIMMQSNMMFIPSGSDTLLNSVEVIWMGPLE